MNENVLIALIEQLKELTTAVQDHNEIMLSHFIEVGEIEMVEYNERDMDS